MENQTQLQLSDIRKPGVSVPYINPQTLYGNVDRNDSIIGNTFVEDTVTANPENLLQGSIATRMARLNDKKNQYDVINNRLKNVDQEIAQESYGRGITQLGQRASRVTRARQLEAEGDLIAADVEALRGNIETANQLARNARIKSGATAKERERLSSLSDKELLFEEYLDRMDNQALAKRIKKEGYFGYAKDISSFPEKAIPGLDDYISRGLVDISRAQDFTNNQSFRGDEVDEFNRLNEKYGPGTKYASNTEADLFYDFIPSASASSGASQDSLSLDAAIAERLGSQLPSTGTTIQQSSSALDELFPQ